MHQKIGQYIDFTHPYDFLLRTKESRTKVIYAKLTNNNLTVVDPYNKWCILFDQQVSLDMYERSFVNLYKITNVTKLRDFQFRLLHKKIPTNKELCWWKIKRNDTCDFCIEKDDIYHTLYGCNRIRNLWIKWMDYIKQNHGINVEVNFTTIVLNNFVPQATSQINTYRYKCQKKTLCFNSYLSEIECIQNMELYIARTNNKVAFYQNKWVNNSRRTETENINEFISRSVENI